VKNQRFRSPRLERLARDFTRLTPTLPLGPRGSTRLRLRARPKEPGDPNGVPALDPIFEPQERSISRSDLMLKLMMDEGPGGGHTTHHEPEYGGSRIRPGVRRAAALYLTNDFSD